jgi:hypothetical protein
VNPQHCAGCRDDFYNGKNPHGVKACWGLKSARPRTRYRLHVDTPYSWRSGYAKKQRPQCYHEQGYVYLDQIPEFAK